MPRAAPVRKINNKFHAKLNIYAVALAIMHLMAALFVYNQHYEGSWGYIFFSIPDLPIIIILRLFSEYLSNFQNWIIISIFGTLWWYWIGIIIAKFLKKN